MVTPQAPYPVQLSVDYPDRPLNRLTSAFRIFLAIPAVILLGTVSGGTLLAVPGYTGPTGSKGSMFVLSGAGGPLFLGPLLMILFRKKYPRRWIPFHSRARSKFSIVSMFNVTSCTEQDGLLLSRHQPMQSSSFGPLESCLVQIKESNGAV